MLGSSPPLAGALAAPAHLSGVIVFRVNAWISFISSVNICTWNIGSDTSQVSKVRRLNSIFGKQNINILRVPCGAEQEEVSRRSR
jgi:hypothetical protein